MSDLMDDHEAECEDEEDWHDLNIPEDPATPFAEAEAAWSEVPRKLKRAGESFFRLRLVYFALESDVRSLLCEAVQYFNGLHAQVKHLVSELQRFTRLHSVTVWHNYRIGYMVAAIICDLLPHVKASKLGKRGLNRSVRDHLFAIFDGLLSDSHSAPSVPHRNRPIVNHPVVPNTPRPSPSDGKLHSSTLVEAAEYQKIPKGVCGQASWCESGVITATEKDTGLPMQRPYGTERLSVPVSWTDWSAF